MRTPTRTRERAAVRAAGRHRRAWRSRARDPQRRETAVYTVCVHSVTNTRDAQHWEHRACGLRRCSERLGAPMRITCETVDSLTAYAKSVCSVASSVVLGGRVRSAVRQHDRRSQPSADAKTGAPPPRTPPCPGTCCLSVQGTSTHVKHALQASDSRSNAATHWGSGRRRARALPSCMVRSEATPTVDTGLYQEHPRRHHCPFSSRPTVRSPGPPPAANTDIQ